MDPANSIPTPSFGSRRNEDIALDLMKFIAAHTDAGRTPAVGFASGGARSADDPIDRLLDLYSRCLRAVEGGKK